MKGVTVETVTPYFRLLLRPHDHGATPLPLLG